MKRMLFIILMVTFVGLWAQEDTTEVLFEGQKFDGVMNGFNEAMNEIDEKVGDFEKETIETAEEDVEYDYYVEESDTIIIIKKPWSGNSSHDGDYTESLLDGNIRPSLAVSGIIRETELNGTSCLLHGARVAFMRDDDGDYLGFAGFVLSDDVPAPEEMQPDTTNSMLLDMQYWGAYFENNFNPDDMVNFSFNLFAGAGKIKYYDDDKDYDDDICAIIEPGLALALNVTPAIRIGVEWNYRWVNDVDLSNLSNGDMSGSSFSFLCKFLIF